MKRNYSLLTPTQMKHKANLLASRGVLTEKLPTGRNVIYIKRGSLGIKLLGFMDYVSKSSNSILVFIN